jgi:hypothetical protein
MRYGIALTITVLPRLLHNGRRSRVVTQRKERLRPAHPHQLRRLAAAHLQLPRHVDHQLDREDPSLCRLVQLQRERGCVEGEGGVIPGVCEFGGGNGRRRHGAGAEVYRARHGLADVEYGR